jgi:hypothetical protein
VVDGARSRHRSAVGYRRRRITMRGPLSAQTPSSRKNLTAITQSSSEISGFSSQISLCLTAITHSSSEISVCSSEFSVRCPAQRAVAQRLRALARKRRFLSRSLRVRCRGAADAAETGGDVIDTSARAPSRKSRRHASTLPLIRTRRHLPLRIRNPRCRNWLCRLGDPPEER